jgi:hypothetical protein
MNEFQLLHFIHDYSLQIINYKLLHVTLTIIDNEIFTLSSLANEFLVFRLIDLFVDVFVFDFVLVRPADH